MILNYFMLLQTQLTLDLKKGNHTFIMELYYGDFVMFLALIARSGTSGMHGPVEA